MTPTLPFDSGRSPQHVDRALHVAEALLVGHAAGVARRRGRVAGLRARRVAVVQVRHQRGVAVHGERADDLLRRPVVAGHVVQHDHARLRVAVERPGEVRLDLVAAWPVIVIVSATIPSVIVGQ